MIHQQCLLCGHDLTLDEQRYKAGNTVIRQCPRCGSDVEFTITDTADTLWQVELRRQMQELEALRAKQRPTTTTDLSTTVPPVTETPKQPKRYTVAKILLIVYVIIYYYIYNLIMI